MNKYFFITLIFFFSLIGCSKNNDEKTIVLSCKGLSTSIYTPNNEPTEETTPKEENPTLTVEYVSNTNPTNSIKDKNVWIISSDLPNFYFFTRNEKTDSYFQLDNVVVEDNFIKSNSWYSSKDLDSSKKLVINRITGEITKEERRFVPEYRSPIISTYKGICQKGTNKF